MHACNAYIVCLHAQMHERISECMCVCACVCACFRVFVCASLCINVHARV